MLNKVLQKYVENPSYIDEFIAHMTEKNTLHRFAQYNGIELKIVHHLI